MRYCISFCDPNVSKRAVKRRLWALSTRPGSGRTGRSALLGSPTGPGPSPSSGNPQRVVSPPYRASEWAKRPDPDGAPSRETSLYGVGKRGIIAGKTETRVLRKSARPGSPEQPSYCGKKNDPPVSHLVSHAGAAWRRGFRFRCDSFFSQQGVMLTSFGPMQIAGKVTLVHSCEGRPVA